MARWQPDGRGRLLQAAIELFAEHGYEQTTVAEIAARAGLTERTFFRHFPDKREVLFAGRELQDLLLAGLGADADPLAAVLAAFAHAGEEMLNAERLPYARRRAAIVGANPELQERELIKMATIAAALAAALRERGVPEPAASVAAQTGTGLFHVAFARWIADGNVRTLPELLEEAASELRGMRAGVSPPA